MLPITRLGPVTFVLAITSCWGADPATAPNVTYIASGRFAHPAISGDDVFELAGEPFSISVVANSAMVPTSHGQQWAKYTMLKMTGTIKTGLEPTPFALQSGNASIELATGNPSFDVFELFVPVNVIGLQINVLADLHMPPGTIANALIHPFPSIPLGPPATVTYSDPATGTSTTLGIAGGTLVATIPGGAAATDATAVTGVQLYAGGAQAITAHADRTQSLRSIGAAPVDLGTATDVVVLQFYAAGIGSGAEVHARIAGEEAPVLYAGPAGQFPGLDQVSVQVPRSLAGRGDTDVALTVDGRTSNPVHLRIQ